MTLVFPLRSTERGTALVIALLTTFLLGSIAAALILVTNTETLIAAAHRRAEETSCAVEAAFDLVLHDLVLLPSWNQVLASPPGNLTSPLADGRQVAAAPDGRALDLTRLTSDRQRQSDAVYGPAVFGADSPRWRLYLHTPLQAVLPSGTAAAPAYLLAWVADDGGDEDGDPSTDANGRILVHAEAYGAAGSRRAVEAAVGRTPAGALQVLAWREMR